MQIQINSHGDTPVDAAMAADIEALLRHRLARHAELFTRLEVHFNPNQGVDTRVDKVICGVEARAAGKRPLKVTHVARRPDLAAEGAAVKLMTAIDRRVARKRTVSRKGHLL